MKQLIPALALCLLAAPAWGASKVEVSLLLSAETAHPGDGTNNTVWAGVRMKMEPRWHTYWRYGGDSGSPTTVAWTLPPGVHAGDLRWPTPHKDVLKVADITLITYTYEDEVILLAPLTLDQDLKPGPLEIKAHVAWQECSDVCVTGKTDVSASFQVGSEPKPSADAELLHHWLDDKVPTSPTTISAKARWENDQPDGNKRGLLIDFFAFEPADFFPYTAEDCEVSAATDVVSSQPQPASKPAPSKIVLRKSLHKFAKDWPGSVTGLLVNRIGTPQQSAEEVKLSIGPSEASSSVPSAPSSSAPRSLPLMLFFAFLGGLILNVMPCVLPVIALKVLSIVNQSKESPGRARQLGIIYGAGVLASFLVLAGVAIAAQHAGGVAGWGSAFRNPQFRVLITILMTLVALNLFGVFEVTLGGRALGAAGQLSAKTGAPGAFFNGVLATILATPCTAPFLGVALGFALTQSAPFIVMIFLASALGLALPFVLLCWNPAFLKILPKPGAWMEQFKVAMGFPILATVVWLFWVTGTHAGPTGVLWLGLFLVVLSLAAWIWGQFVQRGGKGRGVAAVLSLLLVALGYGGILEKQLHWRSSAAVSNEQVDWKPWSANAVTQARREGHPVLIDFTADTCLNCQLNKLTSLEIPSTRAKLKEINATAFVADYTDENPAIAEQLKKYGRGDVGVPLVLVYPARPDAAPIVLPTILTPSIVQKALDQAAK